MSEYWKSTPKYWCKHCSAYIRDTPFERKQHESTAKHQNNLKRFLRDIQNDHERSEREKEKAKAEVQRLNQLTSTSSGFADTPSKSGAPTFHRDKTSTRTADDQKRQWQQLADMGIRAPDHVRAEMAMVGAWKAVPQQSIEQSPEQSLSVGVRKHKLEDDDEGTENVCKTFATKKVWGKSIKTLPGENEDSLDVLLSGSVSLKNENQATSETDNVATKLESAGTLPSVSYTEDAPHQDRPTTHTTTMPDNQEPAPSEGAQHTSRSLANSATPGLVKDEATDDSNRQSIEHIPEASHAPVFKKRKAKAKPAT